MEGVWYYMSILGKIFDTALKVADVTLVQVASNKGFEAGSNGEAPRTIFAAERYKEAYDQSYQRGQEASKTNLANTVSKKLKDL